MNKIKSTIIAAAIILICGVAYTAKAQGPGLPGEPEDTPIDGGVTLALAAPAAYGIKKLRKK